MASNDENSRPSSHLRNQHSLRLAVRGRYLTTEAFLRIIQYILGVTCDAKASSLCLRAISSYMHGPLVASSGRDWNAALDGRCARRCVGDVAYCKQISSW